MAARASSGPHRGGEKQSRGPVVGCVTACPWAPCFLESRVPAWAPGIRATQLGALLSCCHAAWRLASRKQLTVREVALSSPRLGLSKNFPRCALALTGMLRSLHRSALMAEPGVHKRPPKGPKAGSARDGSGAQPCGSPPRLHWPSFCPEGQPHTARGRGAQTKGPAGPDSLGPVPTLPDTALALRLSPVWPQREAGARALRLGSLAGPVVLRKKGSGRGQQS